MARKKKPNGRGGGGSFTNGGEVRAAAGRAGANVREGAGSHFIVSHNGHTITAHDHGTYGKGIGRKIWKACRAAGIVILVGVCFWMVGMVLALAVCGGGL